MIDFLCVANEYLLILSSLLIVASSVYISFRLRFIQLGIFPAVKSMVGYCFSQDKSQGRHTILPYEALFTAMSTTLGIGTLVAPVIAIHLGGPGALLGFLIVSFFGGASTYTEVNLCIKYREKRANGEIIGGPMPYLSKLLSPAAAVWYALCASILLIGWSGAQANQLAAFLNSPLLGDFRIPTYFSGAAIAVFVIATLLGGIKRVSSFSAKIVPVMFVLYVGSSLWILLANITLLPAIIGAIFQSALTPTAMASGTLVGGVMSALRWGVLKGAQVSEAGIGTQTIPHSMAETKDPAAQGMLAIMSTFTSGFIAFLSGSITLITGTWEDASLPLGMSMLASSFSLYFSTLGVFIVGFCTLLFAVGTILGNSYNGSQCFTYLFHKKWVVFYYAVMAVAIFAGSIAEVKTIWSLVDPLMAGIALPHLAALTLYAHRHADELVKGPEPIQST